VADSSVTEIELEKVPPFGVIVGVATVSANVTVRVKTVECFMPPPADVTVIG
jgi:hypothetical protein